MVATYRFDDEILRGQVTELLVERGREMAELDVAAQGIVTRRTARAAVGAVGIAGGLGVFAAAVWSINGQPSYLPKAGTSGALTETLLAAWGAMGIAYVLGRLYGPVLYRRAIGEAPALTGRPRVDLGLLERVHPKYAVAALLERLHGPSTGWLLAAFGLLMPLTIHLGVWLVAGVGVGAESWRKFDAWILSSTTTVGFAHIVLAALLARLRPDELVERGAIGASSGKGFRILGLTTLAACFPGFLWFLIPPVLTAVTGALFIPLSIYGATRKLESERAALASLDA
jgi:hypothetical protein